MKPAEIALQQTLSEPVAQRSRCSSRQGENQEPQTISWTYACALDRGTAGVRGVRKWHDFMFLFESQSSRQRSTQPIAQHLEFSPTSGRLRSLVVRPELRLVKSRNDGNGNDVALQACRCSSGGRHAGASSSGKSLVQTAEITHEIPAWNDLAAVI